MTVISTFQNGLKSGFVFTFDLRNPDFTEAMLTFTYPMQQPSWLWLVWVF